MAGFHCLGKSCPNHCCGSYDGISPNLRPMGSVGMSEIILLPKDVEALKEAGHAHLIQENADGIARIRTAPDGTCAALVDGRCAVYTCRPAICKAYPFYLDMFAGVCVLTECPGVGEDLCVEDYPEAVKELLEIYQYWIEIYHKKLEKDGAEAEKSAAEP